MTDEIVLITLIERADDDSGDSIIELLCTPAQARAYHERRFVPGRLLTPGRPSQV